MSNGVNLLEPNNTTNTIVPVKKLHVLRFVAVGLLFLVSFSSIVLFILVALSPLPGLKKHEQNLRINLSNSRASIGKLALIDERTTSISQIIAKRKSLDQSIEILQSKMSKNVTVSAIKADKERITMTVQSSSLQSLDGFLNGIMQLVSEKKVFSRATLNDLAVENTSNKYTVTVQLFLL